MNIHQWRDHVLRSNASTDAMFLAFVLAQYYVRGKPTYPCNQTLADKTKLSLSTIKVRKKELKELGLIDYSERRLPGKSNNNCFYEFKGLVQDDRPPHDQSSLNQSPDDRPPHGQSPDDRPDNDRPNDRPPHGPKEEEEVLKKKIYIKKIQGNNWKEKFGEFWEEYGNFLNRSEAEKAFLKIKDTKFETIMEGVRRYRAYVAANSWYNQRHASTWLNKRGWENIYEQKPVEVKPPEMTEEEKLMHLLGVIYFELTVLKRAVDPAKVKFLKSWESENNQKVTWIHGDDWKKQKLQQIA